MDLVYLQYYFDDEEHKVNFNRIHGNAKGEKIGGRPRFSVKEKIRLLSREGVKRKRIFQEISKSAAGFEGGRSFADFPVSMTQIYDISRKDNKKLKVADNIMELVEMCSKQQISGNPFFREVRTAPEFSAVLANNCQLDDMVRFCTRSSTSVFGIDPTFNICDHNVTVTTFKHPLLVNSSGVSQVLLGPVLLQGEKTFESYFTLPSTLVRLKPEIGNLRTFGTNREINLYQAMNAC